MPPWRGSSPAALHSLLSLFNTDLRNPLQSPLDGLTLEFTKRCCFVPVFFPIAFSGRRTPDGSCAPRNCSLQLWNLHTTSNSKVLFFLKFQRSLPHSLVMTSTLLFVSTVLSKYLCDQVFSFSHPTCSVQGRGGSARVTLRPVKNSKDNELMSFSYVLQAQQTTEFSW